MQAFIGKLQQEKEISGGRMLYHYIGRKKTCPQLKAMLFVRGFCCFLFFPLDS